jgi:hypothetical protein
VVASVVIGLTLASLTVAPSGAGRSADELRLQAEDAFAEGVQQAAGKPNDARMCFGCSAVLYERLLQTGAANPALYRNLGNAHLLARDPENAADDGLPRAILAYRRGLRQDPSDGELQRNLEFARQQVNYPPPGTFGNAATEHRPPWLPRWPGVLLGIAVGFYSLGWLALARWAMVRRGGWVTAAVCAFAAMLLFVAAFSVEVWQIRQESRYPLVVIARDGVQLLVGNGYRYPPRYETPVNRGVEARLRYDRGRWLQIELGGGEIGWVPRDAVLIDAPEVLLPSPPGYLH